MGCSPTTNDTCIGCFNWGSGPKGPRALIDNACTTVLANTAIADCKQYFGDNDGQHQTMWNCSICNTNWQNQDVSINEPTCSNEPLDAEKCDLPIENCLQSVCYTWNGIDFVKVCKMCIANYTGTAETFLFGGYSGCTSVGTIFNCEYHYLAGINSQVCYSCKQGYAVHSTPTACIAYTTDPNCRQLNMAGTCKYCWHAYYWDDSLCILSSNFIKFSSLVFSLMILSLLN